MLPTNSDMGCGRRQRTTTRVRVAVHKRGFPLFAAVSLSFLFRDGAPLRVLHFFPGAAHMFKLKTVLNVYLLQVKCNSVAGIYSDL